MPGELHNASSGCLILCMSAYLKYNCADHIDVLRGFEDRARRYNKNHGGSIGVDFPMHNVIGAAIQAFFCVKNPQFEATQLFKGHHAIPLPAIVQLFGDVGSDECIVVVVSNHALCLYPAKNLAVDPALHRQ